MGASRRVLGAQVPARIPQPIAPEQNVRPADAGNAFRIGAEENVDPGGACQGGLIWGRAGGCCGTAIPACWFVQLHHENHAFGVDLHGPTLAWGRKHTVPRLPEAEQPRVKLVKANLMDVSRPRADIIAALNFSYGIFKTRATLGAYRRNSHRSLRGDGLPFLDAWGGSDRQRERPDRIRNRGFVCVWDQVRFDPVNYHTLCRIHFEFPDETRIRNAFEYDWRLWTLPDLQELMAEAGFRDIHVLWEGTHRKTGKGNGVFYRVTNRHADRAWIAYVVGRA
jgi:hypothetical protein